MAHWTRNAEVREVRNRLMPLSTLDPKQTFPHMRRTVLLFGIASICLTGCMKTVSYYTSDDPSIAVEQDTCHGYMAKLRPLKDDAQISSSLTVWFWNYREKHDVNVALSLRPSPGTEFRLIDRSMRITLPSGEQRSAAFNRRIREWNVILDGAPVRFVTGPSTMWSVRPMADTPGTYVTAHPGISLGGKFEFQTAVPKNLTVHTPAFAVNGVIYPTRAVPIHLETITKWDGCEA